MISEETINQTFKEQIKGMDHIFGLLWGIPIRFGLGWGLNIPHITKHMGIPESTEMAFWGGYGGSICVMIPEKKACIAYAMNKMVSELLDSERSNKLIKSVVDTLYSK